ncbi:chemotaxis protein CheY [Sulfurifustis variabilis]|uniref:Chemotaxis protein CheY n=1 Tax=Sulfurifustis variabilis TaxID=1675686 RepID=A0A1B4V6D8_9GAMM|nr:response regulator [Sulfurifustis variabilis]BAU49080.1 chemotaxis protein CheY [Sulfurifustis variabilis]
MREHTLVVIEDNDEDFDAFVRALRDARRRHRIRRFTSGDEALAHLGRTSPGGAGDAALPALILLDLNLPGTDGREVLARIKRDPRLRRIPVIVNTHSSHPSDVEACYDNGANSYMVKSMEFERYQRDIRLMAEYWLEAAIVPANMEGPH